MVSRFSIPRYIGLTQFSAQFLSPTLIYYPGFMIQHAFHLYKRFKQIEMTHFLGVLEAMNAGVGKTIKLVLQRRKGWIKLALRYGVDLVPTFSFGEHSIYEQKEIPEGENDY